MTRARYSKRESLNRILRAWEGEDVSNDAPETLVGDVLSEDEALSDFAELMVGSLPGRSGILPVGIRTTPAAYSDAKEFYVCPDHPNASDTNSGENPAYPLSTIQRAVNLSRAYHGDVIYVTSSDSWQYGASSENGVVENVIIPATKPGIALVGVGRGPIGAYWQPAVTGSYALTIQALDVIVDGFGFWYNTPDTSQGLGILCDWASPTKYGENVLIQNCHFLDDVHIGIRTIYAYHMNIRRCQFMANALYGIYADAGDDAPDYWTVEDNWFRDCGVALHAPELKYSLIRENQVFNANAQAGNAATNEGFNFSSGAQNMVMANFFSCLLPVPANGDYDDLNSASATDAWVGNVCLNGTAVTNPT